MTTLKINTGKYTEYPKTRLISELNNNARAVKEEVRRRDKGPNVIEKIQKSLRNAKAKHLVKNHEGYFKTIVANGIPFRVRLTDMTKRAVEFIQEIDPSENLGDAEEAEGEDQGEGDQSQKSASGDPEGEEDEKQSKKSSSKSKQDEKQSVSYFKIQK